MREYIDQYNAFGKDRPADEQPLYHMNCAEVLLRAGSDAYGLSLSEETFKTMRAFGGGFQAGRSCGALVGALAVLSHRYGEERPTDDAKLKRAAKLMVAEFEKDFGSTDCEPIKARFRDPVRACDPVKEMAGEVLERVVAIMDEEQ